MDGRLAGLLENLILMKTQSSNLDLEFITLPSSGCIQIGLWFMIEIVQDEIEKKLL